MKRVYQVTAIAGNGKKGVKDGNALEAMFFGSHAVCSSSDGRIYVTEQLNSTIRMIYNDQVTTIAGNGKSGYQDGNALEAMFCRPQGICASKEGKLYVSDTFNNTIRMIYNDEVTTIAGNGKKGYKDGKALEAMFNCPHGICISNDGKLYITDTNNHIIRIISNNQVATIAGNGKRGFKDGNALEAMFCRPQGICISNDDKIYISDPGTHRIKMIHNGQVTTIAGNGQPGFQDGNALEAMFNCPDGICISKYGRLYISDSYNHRIRMFYNDQLTTIAGNHKQGKKDGNALEAMFSRPLGICASNDDRSGRLYVLEQYNYRIRMIYLNLDPICPKKSPFGFALLLDMQNTFCDCQISFNNVIYHLHSTLINVRCPLLLDQSYFSLLQQSNISNESFDSFVTFLYTNKLAREYNQTWPTRMTIKTIVELVFIFDLFMNWILEELKVRFTKQLIEMLTINQEESIRVFIVDLLPSINNLKQLIKTRPVKSTDAATTTISYTEYCYNLIVHELQQRRPIVEQYLTEYTTKESYTSIIGDMMVNTNEIDPIDDQSMVFSGAELTELCKLAFEKTSISKIAYKENKSESLISTQHLDAWTRPDFVIKLSNDDDNISYDVHKIVLCGRWKYFCQMIESGMKESQDNEMTLSDDWNKSRFEKMMKYIYLNEIEFESLSDVEWLMENGKLYGMIIDSPPEDQTPSDSIDQMGAYGFEYLYDHCLGVLASL